MNIIFSVNETFLDIAEEAIFSISYYNKEHIDFYLIYNNLPEEKLKRFERFVAEKCNNKLIPLKFNLKEAERIPQVLDGIFIGIETYYRLFAPFILPENVEKAIYMDVDLICQGSLDGLYNEEFEDNYFIGCQDRGIVKEDLERLKLPLDYKYINAGVIMMNLKKFRENFTLDAMIDLILKEINGLKYLDQDFINKVFKGQIKVVSNKYNWLVKTCKYIDMPYEPVIIHYAGSNKPWHDDISRYEVQFIEPYYKVLELEGKIEYLERLKKVHNEYWKKNENQ